MSGNTDDNIVTYVNKWNFRYQGSHLIFFIISISLVVLLGFYLDSIELQSDPNNNPNNILLKNDNFLLAAIIIAGVYFILYFVHWVIYRNRGGTINILVSIAVMCFIFMFIILSIIEYTEAYNKTYSIDNTINICNETDFSSYTTIQLIMISSVILFLQFIRFMLSLRKKDGKIVKV